MRWGVKWWRRDPRRQARPRAGHRGRVNHPGPRDDRNRREPSPAVLDQPRRAGRVRPALNHLAVHAQQDGTFAQEIVPVPVAPGSRADNRARRASAGGHHTRATRGAAAIMGRTDPEATVTAGNASGQNDGAAVLHHHAPRQGRELGLEPSRAWSPGRWRVSRRDDGHRGRCLEPRALQRAGLSMDRHGPDRAERAVRVEALGVLREWELPNGLKRVNVHGSRDLALDTRSARREGGYDHVLLRELSRGARATGWRRCASAGVRGWPRSSRTPRRRGVDFGSGGSAPGPGGLGRGAEHRRFSAGCRLGMQDGVRRRATPSPCRR